MTVVALSYHSPGSYIICWTIAKRKVSLPLFLGYLLYPATSIPQQTATTMTAPAHSRSTILIYSFRPSCLVISNRRSTDPSSVSSTFGASIVFIILACTRARILIACSFVANRLSVPTCKGNILQQRRRRGLDGRHPKNPNMPIGPTLVVAANAEVHA